jgi:uncharacterized protein (TIGR03000 family)
MGRHWFTVVATGAAVLTMLVAEAGFAQVIVGIRPWGIGLPVGGVYPYSPLGYSRYGYSPYGYAPYGAYAGYGFGWYTYPTYGYYQTATYVYVPDTPRASSTYAGLMSQAPAYATNPVTSRTALIEVRVPAEAEVWFNGEKSNQAGAERSFRSKPLEADKIYTFEVKARWKEDGKPVEKTRKVRLMASEQVRITLLDAAS